MPGPYRLCAFDLDDTLLGADHYISARNAAAVRALEASGATIVLASGRMHNGVAGIGTQCGITGPIISYNGAMVRAAANGEVWQHDRVPGDATARVMDYCRANELQLNFYRDERVLTARWTAALELYATRTLCAVEVVPRFHEVLREEPSTKLVIVDTPARTYEIRDQFRAEFGDSLYITKTSDEYVEFMTPRSNKGYALQLVAQRLGIPREQVAAFGDSYNDIPMLEWAGLGVAMANGRPDVRSAADSVTASNTDDGVAQVIERWL